MGESLLKRATFEARNSHQLSIVIVPIIMGVLATGCVWARFRARRIVKTPIMFDDWLCLVALILTWAFQGVNLAAVFAGGAGLPIAVVMALDPNALTTFLKIIVANFSLWIITVSVVQLCILFFYLRIFGIMPIFRWLCWILIVLITAFGIAGFFSEVFACTPVKKAWTPTMTTGHCIEQKPYCTSIGIIHVVFDFGIVILPMPWIWKLQVALRSKIVLSVLVCLGLVASMISLIKISCIIDITGIPQEDVTDYLWTTILLQTLELPIGIICCCVPTLKPVAIEIAPKFSSVAAHLLAYASGGRSRGSPSGSFRYNKGSNHSSSDRNDSSAGFARLNDSNTHVGQTTLGNKTTAQADDIEMVPPKDDGAKSIHVANSYTIDRQ